MDRKKKILLAVTVVAILLLALLALWLLLRPAAAPPGVVEEPVIIKPLGGQLNPSGGTSAELPAEAPAAEPVAPPTPDVKSNLKRLAAAFAERYGSFSNTSNFENLTDLEYFMTDAFAAKTERYVADARAKGVFAPEYSGSTTRSLSAEVTAFDETRGSAVVSVKTQRQQMGAAAGGESVYYQDLVLNFLRVKDIWQVNAAQWAAKSGG